MSQRNPMNERYQSEDRRGVTRKSAATAKPKAKAAASVYIKPAGKTPQEKKEARKAERLKADQRQRRYYSPKTKEYKRLRIIWWVLLGIAIAGTVLAFALQQYVPAGVSYALIALTYACVIAAFVLEFTKIRKERERYAGMMQKHKNKELRAAEKREKAELRAQRAEAQEKLNAANAAEREKKKGISRFFSKSKKTAEGTSEVQVAETPAEPKKGKSKK